MFRISTIIALLAIATMACKKDKGPGNAELIIGNWKYAYSNSGAGNAANFYDSTFADNLAESLQFTPDSIVHYSYWGITTWSNYLVPDGRLILIGGVSNDTLLIRELNQQRLQLSPQTGNTDYRATYERF